MSKRRAGKTKSGKTKQVAGQKRPQGSKANAARKNAPHVLHLHSTFAPGGKELRSAKLINAFGKDMRHSIVSGVPGELGAANAIKSGVAVDYPDDFPSLTGRPTPKRLVELAKAMQPYDLVLTYNWGAMDAALAHTLLGAKLALPPLIHHEDGFNDDEREKLKTSRNWFRRIALGRSAGLVVPSERLEEIALDIWAQPMGRVKLIANGVDTARFRKTPQPDAMRGIIKHKDEFWVGTMAGLRPVKNLSAMVRAFAKMPKEWQLVIIGDGPERDAIRAESDRLGITYRVHLPGFAPDPAQVVGLFDIFALSSHSEQFPISVLEAMAAGKPIAAPDVGDIRTMVAEENLPYIVPAGDETALATAFQALAADPKLRKQIGEANRAKAAREYDEKDMIATYRRLYDSALGLPRGG